MNNTHTLKWMNGLLVVLVSVFVSILFISTMDIWTSYSVEFEDSIPYNSSNQNNFNLGTITINNSGFFSQRVYLPNFLICTNTNEKIRIEFSKQESSNTLFSNSQQHYIDVDAKSQEVIQIRSYYYSNPRFDKTNTSKIKKLYVYSIDRDDTYYSLDCRDMEFVTANKTISLER